jgi:NAD(P)-dependent dehydrogenase (short-subunit alcohol dehydrogenase family)
VVFLASEQASYIEGQTFLVNGGAYFLDADACEPNRRE